jgi:hypothetical protein
MLFNGLGLGLERSESRFYLLCNLSSTISIGLDCIALHWIALPDSNTSTMVRFECSFQRHLVKQEEDVMKWHARTPQAELSGQLQCAQINSIESNAIQSTPTGFPTRFESSSRSPIRYQFKDRRHSTLTLLPSIDNVDRTLAPS